MTFIDEGWWLTPYMELKAKRANLHDLSCAKSWMIFMLFYDCLRSAWWMTLNNPLIMFIITPRTVALLVVHDFCYCLSMLIFLRNVLLASTYDWPQIILHVHDSKICILKSSLLKKGYWQYDVQPPNVGKGYSFETEWKPSRELH